MSNNTFKVRGYFGEWRNATKEEAIKMADHFFRDFPEEQTNKEIFENHIKGLSYEEWMASREQLRTGT